jgi:hypothetical protein
MFYLKLPSLFNNQATKLNLKEESDSFLNDSSTFSKPDLVSFLKSNLLIELSEIKNGKVIVHSKKNDVNLAFLFTNKRIRATSAALSDSEQPTQHLHHQQQYHTLQPAPQQAPPPSQLLILPRIFDNESVSVSTSSSNNTLARMDNQNGSWRDRFYQFYNALEVNNSDSYRKSYKVTFDRPDQSPPLPNLSMSKQRRSNRK